MTKIGADVGYRDLTRDPVVLKDGSLLTKQRAAEWDLEIEQRLRRGRPTIDQDAETRGSGPRSHSPQVSARVPRALLAKLEERAEAEGKSTSEIVREALRAYVA